MKTLDAEARHMFVKRMTLLSALVAAVVTALLLAVGCGGVRSTSGVLFARSAGDAEADAARASASQDIPCSIEKVRIVGELDGEGGSARSLVIVEGCGERLTYAICRSESVNLKCELIARMTTSAPAHPPARQTP